MSDNHEVAIGALIIGDELLTGKRRDKHLPYLIELLEARGLELAWARTLGDDAASLTENLRQTFASKSIVFSFGGIGGTPDDRTRQSAAAALGLPVEPHPEGLTELEAQFGPGASPLRRRMVEFPKGASIIPNPVNRIPGFSILEHHFVPGFPSMAWPMVEWVLDNRYRALHRVGARVEEAITVYDCRESQVTERLESLELLYPDLRIFCLPHADEEGYQVELGARGAPHRVAQAMHELRHWLSEQGFRFEPTAGRVDE